MVSVEPVDLVFCHQRHLDQLRVVETEGQGLEGVPFVFGRRGLGRFGRNDGDQVLRTNAPFVSTINTRFIGDDVAYFQRRRIIVRTHVLRSFVATEEMAYAVPCTVTESDTCFPHVLLGECVQLVASCTSRETCPCQGNMTFEHVGVIQFGLLRDSSSEPDSTSDVGRAVEVLTARIEQQHAFWFDDGAVVFGRRIMDDGAVTLITRDCTETLFDEVLAHHSELVQFLH